MALFAQSHNVFGFVNLFVYNNRTGSIVCFWSNLAEAQKLEYFNINDFIYNKSLSLSLSHTHTHTHTHIYIAKNIRLNVCIFL